MHQSTIGDTLDALQKNPDLDRLRAVTVLDDASCDATVDCEARLALKSAVGNLVECRERGRTIHR
jgi:hypothetical protein